VESGQQDGRLAVRLVAHEARQRLDREVGPARVHGRDAEALQEVLAPRRRRQALPEELHRLLGAPGAQGLPPPVSEAAGNVTAQGGALGHAGGGLAEALARLRELAPGEEANPL